MGEEEPDGTYRVSDSGKLQRYEDSEEESETEEERERVLPEDDTITLSLGEISMLHLRRRILTKGEIFFRLDARLRIRPALSS